MHVAFVTNLDVKEHEGIYKKIRTQASALAHIFGSTSLIFNNGREEFGHDDQRLRSGAPVEGAGYQLGLELIRTRRIAVLYIRHARFTLALWRLLRAAAKARITTIYEIPTYPYFAEQIRASRRKHRAIIKILVDAVGWPIIYRYATSIFVVTSRSSVHRYRKMVEITNGADSGTVSLRTPKNVGSPVRLVTVGTIYPYHGYDRVLRGLQRCGERANGRIVEFHVIGSSRTIDDLRRKSRSLGLRNVWFHGRKSSEELNLMFDQFDAALGGLGLHRRHADIDTTLKHVEYCFRGIPIITCGRSPLGWKAPATIYVPADDTPIDIPWMIEQLLTVQPTEIEEQSARARRELSWEAVLRRAWLSANLPPAEGSGRS